MSKKVSVVILNWNGLPYIIPCIESVVNQTYNNIEIIIIDNNSSDGSMKSIKKKFGNLKNLKIIRNYENLGFAGGMNKGIEASSGCFVLPLNSDVFLGKKFIETCIHEMENYSKVGAIGGRVYSWENGHFTKKIRKEGEFTAFRRTFRGLIEYSGERCLVFGPNGSFPLLRKKMLNEVRKVTNYFFDPKYFTGWEDSDLWFRMHHLDWEAIFIPYAYGWHVGSASAEEKKTFFDKSLEYRRRILRNRYFTFWKNISFNNLLFLLPILLPFELLLPFYLLIKSPETFIQWIRAVKDVIKQYPILRVERRKILKSSKVSHKKILKLFKGI